MARPRFQLDEQLIKSLAGMNCTMDEIAAAMRVSKRVLERRYVKIIEEARRDGKASLKRRMWQCAMGYTDTVTELVVTRKEIKRADGTTQKISTKEPIRYEKTYMPNTGMQIWLSKQMLGYSEKVDATANMTGNQTVTHKWNIMAKPAQPDKPPEEKPAGPEEIKKAQDEWID